MNPPARDPTGELRIVNRVALVAQVLAALVVVLGDIGFDKPGKFGLDFGHLLLLAGIWCVATLVGWGLAWRLRGDGALVPQMAVTFATLALVVLLVR